MPKIARASASNSGAMMTSEKISAMASARPLSIGAVGDDDAAERGLLVGLEGLVPGFEEGVRRSHAARVGVLQDADRRTLELADEVGRGGDIEDVVIAEFLALELFEGLVERAVERGLLVRVFAVAEALGDGQGGREAGGQAEDVAEPGLGLRFEVIGNRGIVGRGALEDLEGEFATEFAEGLGLPSSRRGRVRSRTGR